MAAELARERIILVLLVLHVLLWCVNMILQTLPMDYPIHRHCWTLGKKEAEKWLAFSNLKFGITTLINQRNNAKLIESVQHLPIERLLIETDAPYFLPPMVRIQFILLSRHIIHSFLLYYIDYTNILILILINSRIEAGASIVSKGLKGGFYLGGPSIISTHVWEASKSQNVGQMSNFATFLRKMALFCTFSYTNDV